MNLHSDRCHNRANLSLSFSGPNRSMKSFNSFDTWRKKKKKKKKSEL